MELTSNYFHAKKFHGSWLSYQSHESFTCDGFFCLFVFSPLHFNHYMFIIFTKTEDMHVNINKNI